MLEEKGERVGPRTEAQIDMKISAHIPEEYIPSSAGRMEMYKKISLIGCPADADDVYDEIVDRYGNMPRCVERLLEVAVTKALCERVGFTKAEARGDTLVVTVGRPDLALWSELFSKYKGMRFSPSGDSVMYRFKGAEPSGIAKAIIVDYFNAYIGNLKGEDE